MNDSNSYKRSWIYSLDIFGLPIGFTINSQKTLNTSLGVFTTIVTIVIYVFLTLWFGADFYYRTNPITTVSTTANMTTPSYNFKNMENKFVAFKLTINNPYIQSFTLNNSFAQAQVYYETYSQPNGPTTASLKSVYSLGEPCGSSFSIDPVLYETYGLNDFTCVPLGLIQGGPSDLNYRSLHIQLQSCTSTGTVRCTDIPFFLTTGADPSITYTLGISMIYPQVFFDPYNKNKPLSVFNQYTSLFYSTPQNIYSRQLFAVNNYTISDDLGWISENINYNYYYGLSSIGSTGYYNPKAGSSSGHIFYHMQIIAGNYKYNYFRSYMKIAQVIANTGGVLKIVLVFFEILLLFPLNFLRNKSLINFVLKLPNEEEQYLNKLHQTRLQEQYTKKKINPFSKLSTELNLNNNNNNLINFSEHDYEHYSQYHVNLKKMIEILKVMKTEYKEIVNNNTNIDNNNNTIQEEGKDGDKYYKKVQELKINEKQDKSDSILLPIKNNESIIKENNTFTNIESPIFNGHNLKNYFVKMIIIDNKESKNKLFLDYELRLKLIPKDDKDLNLFEIVANYQPFSYLDDSKYKVLYEPKYMEELNKLWDDLKSRNIQYDSDRELIKFMLDNIINSQPDDVNQSAILNESAEPLAKFKKNEIKNKQSKINDFHNSRTNINNQSIGYKKVKQNSLFHLLQKTLNLIDPNKTIVTMNKYPENAEIINIKINNAQNVYEDIAYHIIPIREILGLPVGHPIEVLEETKIKKKSKINKNLYLYHISFFDIIKKYFNTYFWNNRNDFDYHNKMLIWDAACKYIDNQTDMNGYFKRIFQLKKLSEFVLNEKQLTAFNLIEQPHLLLPENENSLVAYLQNLEKALDVEGLNQQESYLNYNNMMDYFINKFHNNNLSLLDRKLFYSLNYKTTKDIMNRLYILGKQYINGKAINFQDNDRINKNKIEFDHDYD